MGRMIGIDLGTTTSCVAVMQGGVPQVIPNQEGARTTPSVVAFDAHGQPLVGEVAKEHARTKPENTVSGVARLIGRRFGSPEVRQIQRFLPYRLVQGRDAAAHVQIGDRVFSPGEILSFVLQRLKRVAEGYLGEPVEEAVITVPAYSGRADRHAIREACQMAGLKVSRVISGSTAAALTYAFENPSSCGQFVAVCDLGGGTLDITILEMTEGLFQVRATSGDTYLGGEDFDYRIIDWLIGEFQGEMGIDLSQDGMALQRLKEAAEKAKCELSTEEKTEIALPFICAEASGPKHLNTVLTRQKYEELTAELLEGAIDACERCLADAGLKPEQIDEVLLVGGQTRSPSVRRAIHRAFGRPIKRAADDGVVAKGAAIQTGIIHGEVKDLVLLDVTPHTLGIETKGGTFVPLIERNTTIPNRKGRLFTTAADDQTQVEVHVLEGESEVVGRNNSLARLELEIPAAPKGVPQIEVDFEIDVSGTLCVGALDEASGRTESMVIDALPQCGGVAGSKASAARQTKALVAVPVAQHTIGIEATVGTFVPLIQRHTRLPVRVHRLVSTGTDPQGRTEVHILQGESNLLAYASSVARIELRDEPTGAWEQAEIEVTFAMDVRGIVSVCAENRATGSGRSATIGPSGRVTYGHLFRRPGSHEEIELDVAKVEQATTDRRVSNPFVGWLRRGGVSREVRLMAAQGRLPLEAEDLLELWTDLLADPDEGVRAAAGRSLSSFPLVTLLPIVGRRDTASGVLSWTVAHRPEQVLREAVLLNTSLPDETIEALAPTLPQALAELVLSDHVRLQRRPSLLAALERNAGLSDDQRRRLLEMRETLPVGEVEAVPPPAPAPAPAPAAPEPEAEPETAPMADAFFTEDQAVVTYLSEEERQQTEKVSVVQKIYRMDVKDKLMTALKGSREERAILIRDPNRLVAMAVLGSPKITEAEIEAFSAMPNVSDQVLRDIATHREWTKRYTVIYNLVHNPRTPIDVAAKLVPRLSPRDIKGIAVDRSVPEGLRRRAREAADTLWREYQAKARAEAVAVLRQLDGLVANTMRWVQALGAKLTPEERQRILDAIETVKEVMDRPNASLSELRKALEEMENAAAIIGRAMLRP